MDWNQIIANPWVGFAGTLFGVLGILASAIIYFRTRRYQQPAYYKSSIRWYDGANVPHKDIKLTFRGKDIARFTITHLAFWNAGNQTIRESDFAPASPLRLIIPDDVEAFDIRITAATAPEIRASLDSPEAIEAGANKEIPVHFDYLDAEDGFSIQVIHDAKSPSGIRFDGKLPGVSKFRSSSSSSRNAGLLSPLGYRPAIRHASTMERWVAIPLFSLGLSGVGIWSIYWAFFKEFHWYQVPGALMVIYLFMPLLFLSEVNPPKALAESALEKGEEPNQ